MLQSKTIFSPPSRYVRSVSRASALGRWEPGETSRSLDVYGGLRSPDVELLLDLLAETEGVAQALRILAVLDQEVHLAWRTHRLRQVERKENIF